MSLAGLLAGARWGHYGAWDHAHHDRVVRHHRRLRLDRGRPPGRPNPFGIVFAALLFGAMRSGAALMQIRAGIPVELIDVLQATILLFLVAGPVIRRSSASAVSKAGLGDETDDPDAGRVGVVV